MINLFNHQLETNNLHILNGNNVNKIVNHSVDKWQYVNFPHSLLIKLDTKFERLQVNNVKLIDIINQQNDTIIVLQQQQVEQIQKFDVGGPNFNINTDLTNSIVNLTKQKLLQGKDLQLSNILRHNIYKQVDFNLDYYDPKSYIHFGSGVAMLQMSLLKLRGISDNKVDNLSNFDIFVYRLLSMNTNPPRNLQGRSSNSDIILDWDAPLTSMQYSGYNIYTRQYTGQQTDTSQPDTDRFNNIYIQRFRQILRQYDQQNQYRLINLIPNYIRTQYQSNKMFIDLIQMCGIYFDKTWVFINNYHSIINRVDKKVPIRLLNNVIKAFFPKVIANYSTSQLKLYYQLFSDDMFDFDNAIYQRLLDTYPYLLKLKGTRQSAKMILNIFGLPDIISLSQVDQAQFIQMNDYYIGQNGVVVLQSDVQAFNLPTNINYEFGLFFDILKIFQESQNYGNIIQAYFTVFGLMEVFNQAVFQYVKQVIPFQVDFIYSILLRQPHDNLNQNMILVNSVLQSSKYDIIMNQQSNLNVDSTTLQVQIQQCIRQHMQIHNYTIDIDKDTNASVQYNSLHGDINSQFKLQTKSILHNIDILSYNNIQIVNNIYQAYIQSSLNVTCSTAGLSINVPGKLRFSNLYDKQFAVFYSDNLYEFLLAKRVSSNVLQLQYTHKQVLQFDTTDDKPITQQIGNRLTVNGVMIPTLKVQSVQFSHDMFTSYIQPFVLTLKTNTSDAIILWKQQGSQQYNTYRQPIQITQDIIIHAYAVKPYYEDSDVTTAKYTFII